jgi:hypothetical protein
VATDSEADEIVNKAREFYDVVEAWDRIEVPGSERLSAWQERGSVPRFPVVGVTRSPDKREDALRVGPTSRRHAHRRREGGTRWRFDLILASPLARSVRPVQPKWTLEPGSPTVTL